MFVCMCMCKVRESNLMIERSVHINARAFLLYITMQLLFMYSWYAPHCISSVELLARNIKHMGKKEKKKKKRMMHSLQ